MQKKSFAQDLLMVVISNLIALLSSILAGFVIPKMLGVTEYGYYKLFALYMGYASLVHFGYVDGVLLSYAGFDYNDLNKERFRQYSKFFIKLESAVGFTIAAIAIVFLPYKLLFVLLGIDVFMLNVSTYYQYVSQGTMRFFELSFRKVLLAISKIVLVIVLVGINKVTSSQISANLYVSALVAIDTVLTLWYIYTYRDVTFGDSESFRSCSGDILNFIKNGFIITISFQTAQIIFSLDGQFVSILFDTHTYGVYSFAYNLITLVTSVIGAISLVLFPRLRRMKKEDIVKSFSFSMSAIAIISFASLIGYQPLSWFIKWYLPDYIPSLEYLKIVFPGLALSCCISIIMVTYFRALDAHRRYFADCVIVLVAAIITNSLAYFCFKTPAAISCASIITLYIWYFICEYYFIKNYRVTWKKNIIYILVLMTAFYGLNYSISSPVISWSIYLVIYLLLTLILYKDVIGNIIAKRFEY